MLEVEDEAVPVTPVGMEVAVEAAEVEVEVEVEAMTMTTSKVAPHPLPSRVFPDVYDYETDDDEVTVFSTMPRCNNN